MKKTIAVFVLSFWVLNANAEKTDTLKRDVVSVNPVSLFYNNLSFFYERYLTKEFSIKIGLNYIDGLNSNRIQALDTGHLVTRVQLFAVGAGITPEIRYHFPWADRRFPAGAYIGLWGRVRDLQISGGDETDVNHIYVVHRWSYHLVQQMAGVLAGYQFLIMKKFPADIFGGPYYNINRYSNLNGDNHYNITSAGDLGETGFGFRFGISAGFSF